MKMTYIRFLYKAPRHKLLNWLEVYYLVLFIHLGLVSFRLSGALFVVCA